MININIKNILIEEIIDWNIKELELALVVFNKHLEELEMQLYKYTLNEGNLLRFYYQEHRKIILLCLDLRKKHRRITKQEENFSINDIPYSSKLFTEYISLLDKILKKLTSEAKNPNSSVENAFEISGLSTMIDELSQIYDKMSKVIEYWLEKMYLDFFIDDCNFYISCLDTNIFDSSFDDFLNCMRCELNRSRDLALLFLKLREKLQDPNTYIKKSQFWQNLRMEYKILLVEIKRGLFSAKEELMSPKFSTRSISNEIFCVSMNLNKLYKIYYKMLELVDFYSPKH